MSYAENYNNLKLANTFEIAKKMFFFCKFMNSTDFMLIKKLYKKKYLIYLYCCLLYLLRYIFVFFWLVKRRTLVFRN